MRVLHILLKNTLQCGIARHVESVIGGLTRLPNIEAAICTVHPRGGIHQRIEALNGRSFSLNACRCNSPIVLWRFAKVIREYKPDIVHIHVQIFWEWLYLALFARNAKVVMTFHSPGQRGSRLKRTIFGIFPVKVSHRYFVSKAVRDYFSDIYPNGSVVYNPAPWLNLGDRGRIRRILGVPDTAKIIGTACRVTRIKRPDLFGKVMCEVLRGNENAHAVVIGDGDETLLAGLKECAKKYSVEGRMHCLGFREDAQILISGLDAYIMTSTSEGMPTAFLEAVGAGVPAVFMNGKGGLKDLVSINRGDAGPIGIDVACEDVGAMVAGVKRLLSDDSFRQLCSENGTRLCKGPFSAAQVARELSDSYASILTGGVSE